MTTIETTNRQAMTTFDKQRALVGKHPHEGPDYHAITNGYRRGVGNRVSERGRYTFFTIWYIPRPGARWYTDPIAAS